jgi:hypothetical protein
VASKWPSPITGRPEYLYVDLESPTCNTAGSCGFDTNGAAANDTVKFTESVVRLGVDYKFNF